MRRAARPAGCDGGGGVHRRGPSRGPGLGRPKAWGPISRRIFAALTDTEGVVAWSRRGLLRRVADELGDLQRIRAQLRATEADMVSVLAELGLSRLADIPALTAVGAALVCMKITDVEMAVRYWRLPWWIHVRVND